MTGDEAVVAQRQIVQIPEHAQSGHLFQFIGDLVSFGDAQATESIDVPRFVTASQPLRIAAETASSMKRKAACDNFILSPHSVSM